MSTDPTIALSNFFGDIAPPVLASIISVITQKIKIAANLSGWRVDLLNLLLNYALFLPYHIIITFLITPPNEMSVWQIAYAVFQGLVYPIMGWIFSAGYYQKFLGSEKA